MKTKHIVSTALMFYSTQFFFFSTYCMEDSESQNNSTFSFTAKENCLTTPFSELINYKDTISLETIFFEDTSEDTDAFEIYKKQQIKNITTFTFALKKATLESQKNEIVFDLKPIEISAKKQFKKKIKAKENKNFFMGFGFGTGIGLGIGIILTYITTLNIKKTNEIKK